MTENQEQDSYFLFKCVRKEFTESTLDGNFHFARNSYFKDLEERQIDKGIGDKREGVWSELIDPQTSKFVITVDGEKFPINFERAVFRQEHEKLKDCPICCFVMLSAKNDMEFDGETGKVNLKPEIEEKLAEQFAGRDLIFLGDFGELITRINTACKKDGLHMLRGTIKYYDDKTEPHPLSQEEFKKFPPKALLYKQKFFEYQKEYRFILTQPQDKDILLNVGNIRDIAYNLGEIKADKLPIELTYAPNVTG
ncbi:hypothetical protein PDK35_10390 [Bacillus cereus group sp. TH153LC]|uniref:hypothetical protein n=1 Tax=Bacillus cereus group sp. TH153LC TaxID=3018059 RepID=UPI0022E1C86B|nr:hypothetical protein [Bacillus cereus group sp. TH153LC]MDA1660372.1 hypothetical protein [Bacillus cereus group sp. TH153LC]